MTARALSDVRSTKDVEAGERVTFRAKVLRVWDSGGLRMCLVGDASGLTRVELGPAHVEVDESYVFKDATVVQYSGGWTSLSISGDGEAMLHAEEIDVPQDAAYIERTFKILSGVQRKKARKEGRSPPWQHPAAPH